MIKKLKQKKGETLVEALISLLIAVLSMAILATAVLASSNINKDNRERDNEYAQQLYDAEGHVVQMDDVTMKVRVQFEGDLADKSADIDIILYGGEDNDFVSYEEKETEE